MQGWLVIGDGTSISCTAQSGSMKIMPTLTRNISPFRRRKYVPLILLAPRPGMVSVTETS
jgi:hypothetical protein